jgi:hypothetical protein
MREKKDKNTKRRKKIYKNCLTELLIYDNISIVLEILKGRWTLTTE